MAESVTSTTSLHSYLEPGSLSCLEPALGARDKKLNITKWSPLERLEKSDLSLRV